MFIQTTHRLTADLPTLHRTSKQMALKWFGFVMVPAERWSDDCKCGFVAVIIQNPLNVFLCINESQSLCVTQIVSTSLSGVDSQRRCSTLTTRNWNKSVHMHNKFSFWAKIDRENRESKVLYARAAIRSKGILNYAGWNSGTTKHRKRIEEGI